MSDAQAQALRLRGESGMSYREIAARLGISKSTVHELCSDLAVEKRRLRRARNECVGCGEPTSGEYCGECRSWSKAEILDAIREWARKHGQPPTGTQWARVDLGLPARSTVIRRFGSWANAIGAAGFERPTHGGHRSTEG